MIPPEVEYTMEVRQSLDLDLRQIFSRLGPFQVPVFQCFGHHGRDHVVTIPNCDLPARRASELQHGSWHLTSLHRPQYNPSKVVW